MMGGMDPADGVRPFRVLAVCTGNICRSPAVERLLAAGLGARYRGGGGDDGPGGPADGDGGLVIASAGTGAVVGSGMTRQMADLVRAAGGNPDGFAARQLTPAMVREADLVLALTRRHRAAIVDLVPGAVRRTFTLRELARLASSVDPVRLPSASAGDAGPGASALEAGAASSSGADIAGRLRALLPLAAARRGHQVSASADDDVVDPYRGDAARYERSFHQLLPAVQAIVAIVKG
jgi:protein-tyrosine phosphatase